MKELSAAAKTITKYREALGWSKRRLAREAMISAPYVVQMENGERPVTRKMLGMLADSMGTPPWVLLSEGGFIPADDLREAETMAARAISDPNIEDRALASHPGGKLGWLISDYLYLLGDDPYGTGWEFGPGGHEIDWTPYAPERMAAADANPNTEEIRRMRFPARYGAPKAAPSPIEGWDELTEADRKIVQQMATQLLRARREGGASDGNAEA